MIIVTNFQNEYSNIAIKIDKKINYENSYDNSQYIKTLLKSRLGLDTVIGKDINPEQET